MGKWRANERFSILRVAKSWGLTPGQFRALPYPEQVEMIAECSATDDMAAYENYRTELRMKNKGAK
jgi:hypothetical protein